MPCGPPINFQLLTNVISLLISTILLNLLLAALSTLTAVKTQLLLWHPYHCTVHRLPTEENSIVNISNQIRQSTSFPNNQCLKYLGDSYSQCTEEYSGNMHAHRSNNTIISIPSDTQSSSSSSSSSSEHRPVHMTSAVQPIHFASVPRPMCQH